MRGSILVALLSGDLIALVRVTLKYISWVISDEPEAELLFGVRAKVWQLWQLAQKKSC